ncbi:hypothetical protein [Nonomuraea sp. 10N515B]|uniref:hypothetical protein n=1 Tax=Nonomuraea sp. 10N515B TaxID=3457422 RepID=UPI003FCCBFD3
MSRRDQNTPGRSTRRAPLGSSGLRLHWRERPDHSAADIAREDTPKSAPKAMDTNAQIRWLRAIKYWPPVHDHALSLLPLYAGLRIGDAVALDVPDVRISARKGVLIIYGKGANPY